MIEKIIKSAGLLFILSAAMIGAVIVSVVYSLLFSAEGSTYPSLLSKFLNSNEALVHIASGGQLSEVFIEPDLRLLLVFFVGFVGFVGVVALSSILHAFVSGGLSLLKYESKYKESI
ncbi:hypothetical protein DU002_10230 [Corallincola holothuriorum]|uniref:Uncharacterized protein n=1 Tax=Corallincola holothuriorum TaxID=2282215 RepID=A0A368NK20_9GAMM|nr:hypothetical protein [Corallincola holothuriorum]RCU49994.1 hypothetical protein DU002_10230 [Corallincola holothuriorum]